MKVKLVKNLENILKEKECYYLLIICLVEDFIPTVKAKTLLLSIRDIRNKRAHDSPITAREVYRLADLTEIFFESTPFKEVVSSFDQLRL